MHMNLIATAVIWGFDQGGIAGAAAIVMWIAATAVFATLIGYGQRARIGWCLWGYWRTRLASRQMAQSLALPAAN
jgi:hypothetical protein